MGWAPSLQGYASIATMEAHMISQQWNLWSGSVQKWGLPNLYRHYARWKFRWGRGQGAYVHQIHTPLSPTHHQFGGGAPDFNSMTGHCQSLIIVLGLGGRQEGSSLRHGLGSGQPRNGSIRVGKGGGGKNQPFLSQFCPHPIHPVVIMGWTHTENFGKAWPVHCTSLNIGNVVREKKWKNRKLLWS